VYLAVNTFEYEISIPLFYVAIVIADGLFWGLVIRFCSNIGRVYFATLVEYNSWNYFFCQRLRLIIGRTSSLQVWGFTYYQKFVLYMLGVNIGTDVEVAGPLLPQFQIPFSEIYLSKGATLTSGVWIGEEYWINGVWHVNPVCIGQNSFVGNLGAVLEGTTATQAVIASLAVINKDSRASKISNSVAIGNPAFYTLQSSKFADETNVPNQFVFVRHTRLLFEFFLLIIDSTLVLIDTAIGLIVSASIFQYAKQFLVSQSALQWFGIVLAGKVSSFLFGMITTLLFKYFVMGKFKPGAYKFFSPWFYCRRFLYIMFTQWYIGELEYWGSSEWTNFVFRLMGVTIGNRVIIEDQNCILEYDMVTIGDDCTLETGSILQPHTFEGRVMTCRPVTLKNGVLVGSGSLVLAGATLQEDSLTECLTLVFKNQELQSGRQVIGGSISSRSSSHRSLQQSSPRSEFSDSDDKLYSSSLFTHRSNFTSTYSSDLGTI
jgi:non-ribosomal peptide synthetase-like protein